jgi:hypothetical protein
MKKVYAVSVAMLIALFLQGCAKIVNGSRQMVRFTSTPAGAIVTVDNQDLGTTPVASKLERKSVHVVQIEMEGYKTHQITLIPRLDGWIAGNLIFGGLIGIAIDAITGSMYRLSPGQVNARLRDGYTNLNKNKDGVYVAVVMETDPAWEKIGNLEKNR